MNRMLMEKARSMLNGIELGHEFQEEAVETSCCLVWTGKKTSLLHLRVFGCDAYVHVPKEKKSKLDNKSKQCIFIGYKDGLKGYKLQNPEISKVVCNQDVVFREVKYVVKHEVLPKEPEKIEFVLKEDELTLQQKKTRKRKSNKLQL